MYFLQGLKAAEISRRLFEEGVIDSETAEGAYRLVRADVEIIRKKISSEGTGATDNQQEARIFTERMEYILRHAARELERTEAVSTSRTKTLDKEGNDTGREVVTARRVDRSAIRQRWAEKYIQAAKAIAVVNGVAVDGRQEDDSPPSDTQAPSKKEAPFRFVFSGKSEEELLQLSSDPSDDEPPAN